MTNNEWRDVQKEPLPMDISDPMFQNDWPLLWVCGEGESEVRMATWGPVNRWFNNKDGSPREFVRDFWQFTEYPGSDEFGSEEVMNVRWYQPVYKPEPPK